MRRLRTNNADIRARLGVALGFATDTRAARHVRLVAWAAKQLRALRDGGRTYKTEPAQFVALYASLRETLRCYPSPDAALELRDASRAIWRACAMVGGVA